MPRCALLPPTATARVAGPSAEVLFRQLVLPASKHAPAPAASVLRHVALESLRRYYLPITDPEHLSMPLYAKNGHERSRTIFNPFTMSMRDLALASVTAPTRAQFGQDCFSGFNAATRNYIARISGASLCQLLGIPFYDGAPPDTRTYNPYDYPSWVLDLIRAQGDAMNAGRTLDERLFIHPIFTRGAEFLLRPASSCVVRYQSGYGEQFPLVETTVVVIPQAVPRYLVRLLDPVPLTKWEQDPRFAGGAADETHVADAVCPPSRAAILFRFTPSVGLPSLEATLHVAYSTSAGFRLARERLRAANPDSPAARARGLVPPSLRVENVQPQGTPIDHTLATPTTPILR